MLLGRQGWQAGKQAGSKAEFFNLTRSLLPRLHIANCVCVQQDAGEQAQGGAAAQVPQVLLGKFFRVLLCCHCRCVGCACSARCRPATTTNSDATTSQPVATPLQGTLLFVGLLLLLWVPLLAFSSGAPTYTIPAVASFSANASFAATNSGGGSLWQPGQPLQAAPAAATASGATAVAEFPVFSTGNRRALQQWLPDDSAMPDELSTYAAQQFQLLCSAPVRLRMGARCLLLQLEKLCAWCDINNWSSAVAAFC